MQPSRIFLALLILTGCGGEENAGSVASEACDLTVTRLGLTAADSVVLQESDSLFLGNPGATFLIDSEKQFYIPDNTSNRVLVFDSSGAAVRTLGRSGGGPGEFIRIGSFGAISGEYLLQDDGGGRRLNIYELLTGSLITTILYQGYLSWLYQQADGDLDVSLIEDGNSRVGTILTAAELQGKSAARLVPGAMNLPGEYQRYPLLAQYVDAKIISTGDTSVVAFGGLSAIIRAVSGEEPDTIGIPACGRRGSPRKTLEAVFRQRPSTAAEQARLGSQAAGLLSALVGLWRLDDGRYLIWYQDVTFEGVVMKGTAYLSLISSDLSSACVDARLEAPGTGRPRIAVKDDAVYLLDQVISEGGGKPRVTSVIRKFGLDDSNCTWLATAG